jgi:hypothetical protein
VGHFVSIAEWGIKRKAHVAHHKQLEACHIPFCSDNKLGAVGAEELVKGDWPELRILTIWWGWRPMLLCIQLCTTWMARHEVIF